jgi:hypothetical protein
MLGVFPETFDLPAAAAIWDVEVDAAQGALGQLLRFSMLEWNNTSKRYRLHDLMRDFAQARLETAEGDGVVRRHAAYYAAYYNDVIDAASGRDALDLVAREWTNIRAGQAWAVYNAAHDELVAARAACALGDQRYEAKIRWNMSLALWDVGQWEKAIEHAEAALKIFEQIEDPAAEKVRKQLDEWKKDRGRDSTD